MKYETYLKDISKSKQDKLSEWRGILDFILEDASAYQDVAEWKDAQQKYNMERMNTNSNNGNNIILMTAHSAKGLEFDKVWIPDCNEGTFPYGQLIDEDACEEERRIFYVAMTRAKYHLEILYVKGMKTHLRLPSRFLNPLLKDKKIEKAKPSQ